MSVRVVRDVPVRAPEAAAAGLQNDVFRQQRARSRPLGNMTAVRVCGFANVFHVLVGLSLSVACTGSLTGSNAERDGGSGPVVGRDGALPVGPDGGGPEVDDGGLVGDDAEVPTDDAGAPLPGPTDAGGPTERGFRVDGRRLLIDGEPLEIRGVCWSPVPRGSAWPPDYARFVDRDSEMMAAAGITHVRTYGPILDRTVLDRLHARGISVLMTVYSWGGDPESVATESARQVIDHPAIAMWLVGNEWNYNGYYTGLPFGEAVARTERVAAALKALDPSRPVATIYGELPSPETLAAIPSVDLWGINAYRGIGFGDLFARWAALSNKPMFMGEYGADAWDARDGGRPNVEAQADATRALTEAILASSTARHADGVVLGGTIFEWNDEWWKDGSGSVDAHDVGGVAPGGGPHPDATFNEEWWGIVDIDRRPRPAYTALQAIYTR